MVTIWSSDHRVSEAFYFTGPEGNGIELYVDRPREQWQRVDGQLHMATLHLDPRAYLAEHLDQAMVAAAPDHAGLVGHIHLQVGNIERAREFYVDAIGFEPTVTSYPGALFAAAGGCHHHVAMNTWNSSGAGPRASGLGQGDVAVTVSARGDLDALTARLWSRGIDFDDDGRRVVSTDPWGTQVTVAVPGTSMRELLDR